MQERAYEEKNPYILTTQTITCTRGRQTKEYNVLQIYHWHFERQIEGYFYAGYNIVGLLEYQNTRYMHGGKVLFLRSGYACR